MSAGGKYGSLYALVIVILVVSVSARLTITDVSTATPSPVPPTSTAPAKHKLPDLKRSRISLSGVRLGMTVDQVLERRPWLRKYYLKDPRRLTCSDWGIEFREECVVSVDGWNDCDVELDGRSVFWASDGYKVAREKLLARFADVPEATIRDEISGGSIRVEVGGDVLVVQLHRRKLPDSDDGKVESVDLFPRETEI